VPRLATVIARPWECWSLLPGRRSGHSLSRSWWGRRRWKPLTLSCLLWRTRRELLPLLVLLGWPLLLLLRMMIVGASVAARRGWSYLPLLILNLPALKLGVEGSINQLVEVVEAVVQQRILDVIIQSLLEILLLVAFTGDVSRGVAGKLKETVMILRHRHRPLKSRTQITRTEIAQCVRLTKEIKDRSKLKRSCREFHSEIPA
jgi:hypothetical protein